MSSDWPIRENCGMLRRTLELSLQLTWRFELQFALVKANPSPTLKLSGPPKLLEAVDYEVWCTPTPRQQGWRSQMAMFLEDLAPL